MTLPPSPEAQKIDVQAKLRHEVDRRDRQNAEDGRGQTPDTVALAFTVGDARALLDAYEAKVRELAYWKVCANCGETMEAPGGCSNFEKEREQGYVKMFEEGLAERESLRAEVAALTAALAEARIRMDSDDAELQHVKTQLAEARREREPTRLADAVQAFRNLPMLGPMTRLRGTPEYGELCDAWKALQPVEDDDE